MYNGRESGGRIGRRRIFILFIPLIVLMVSASGNPNVMTEILPQMPNNSYTQHPISNQAPPLSPLQQQELNKYAKATVRYFTSHEVNNTEVSFTHAFFGTGKFRDCDENQICQEIAWELTRGYGSHANINEVTLRFLSLAVSYKMNWLDYLPQSEQYSESWGQIRLGLETLRWIQEYGDTDQFKEGHFHRTYLTVKNDDTDEERQNIKSPPGEDIQSSDDNALPFMNLLILEGLAQDPAVDIPDSSEIVRLCQEIRNGIDLKSFVVNDRIIHNYTNGIPEGEWDRISSEGPIILTALMLSDQITQQEFEDIAARLKNSPVDWDSIDNGVIKVDKPSYHSAMFIHGLRAIHGLPVTPAEFAAADFFEKSTKPVFKAHQDYSEHYGYKALGSQVMTQELEGIPLFEFDTGSGRKQVQFPGNEDNLMPIPGQEPDRLDRTLSRATGPHAWFIPLARWRYLHQQDIEKIFDWMTEYEQEGFFHTGSDIELGWEAAIPWTPDDKEFAWQASDGTWKYTDWGRPYEALNTAYIVLSIFDALNPDAPLASYNVEAERTKDIIAYLDKFEIYLPLIMR